MGLLNLETMLLGLAPFVFIIAIVLLSSKK
jgi:hypothetical protein